MEWKWKLENGKIKQPGTLVTVDKHKIHMYKQGKGADTIVFMSGGGTCCLTLDFKQLWTFLSSEFTVAWVDTRSISRKVRDYR